MLSAWSGIRPLASDPDASSTASVSRDHVVSRDTDGMITVTGTQPGLYFARLPASKHCFTFFQLTWWQHSCCHQLMIELRMIHKRNFVCSAPGSQVHACSACLWHRLLPLLRGSPEHLYGMCASQRCGVAGGKWTTYRRMAEDAVDLACASDSLPACPPCCTAHLPLIGAQGYDPSLFTEVAQNYTVPHRPGAIDTRVAKHLAGLSNSSASLQSPDSTHVLVVQ